jgi:glyoxylase-like metal-dependent hydrolase (beta-lactamase superfamily II)
MVSEKLAPGVYAFYDKNAPELNAKGGSAATSAGLIIGEKGALMIETLLNKRLNAQIQQISENILNNKPILFAVNTSYHGDHWYGNMYMPSTTIIIQHLHAKQYIDKHLEDDKKFMCETLGRGRGIEEIETRTGDILVEQGSKIQIDLGGGKIVEIIDFGFGQTGGDLFIWEPESKIIWAGNVIPAPKPRLPWLLDGHIVDILQTLTKVYNFLPNGARIVPGHGIPMTREDLRWPIDYLTAVRNSVQKGIDQGLNLEEIIKLSIDDTQQFRGYAYFDWIHPKVNVPKTYEELKSNKKIQ